MIICMAVRGKIVPIDPGYVARLLVPGLQLVVARHFSAEFNIRGANDNWL